MQLDSGDAEGLVLAAEITPEGDTVMVTVALPDGTLPKQSLSDYSVS